MNIHSVGGQTSNGRCRLTSSFVVCDTRICNVTYQAAARGGPVVLRRHLGFTYLRLVWLLTGEVLVWDIARDGDFVIASSGIGDDSHREPVSRLQWVTSHDGKTKKYNVSQLTQLLSIPRVSYNFLLWQKLFYV